MTISEDVKAALRSLNVSVDEAEVAAKGIALSIIEESQESDTPLEGMVYNVWGLYNDGSPKCRLTAPHDDDNFVFSGQFRVEDEESFVVRRQTISQEDFMTAIKEIRQPPSPS
ncbi:hypothetical protein [Longibacter salinarum]|nr:hypothetical protein [Longibacter salinarum]